ncbi:LytR family transcriptional regulator [Saccharomonospora piscinae]|uniref:LCP family protein n=1 Tax=Saccharomonospora piscinae TaxID=687388 RepID=UPI001105E0D3|nr:LCP family protein [Saccharomonospora piscinae]TLW89625.1 LytR family transcriptional regulator [Saccharomonospora piscinae]
MTDGEPAVRPGTKPVHRRSRLGTAGVVSGRTVVSLLSVAVLVLTGYGWQMLGSAQSNLATTDVFEDTEPGAEPLDGAVDILLVGMDSRKDAQGNPLPREVLDELHAGDDEDNLQTDTMILVHIPQDGTSATAISFPRDSWVELAGGYGNSRLNAAYRYAYNDTVNTLAAQGETDLDVRDDQGKVAGRKNLIATIEQLVGRPGMIDRYAEVNLASFYEITKAVNGVDVCLREPVKEIKSGIDLPAGPQTIEGVDALSFVRQRIGLQGGDLGRINRQQAFLSGLARKMLSSEILLNPGRLSEVIGAVQKSVVLSEDWDLLTFADQMRGLSGGQIEFHTMPIVGDATIGGADVLQVDPAQVGEFVNELIPQRSEGDPRLDSVPATVPGAASYAVDIYDATGDTGVGESARSLLAGQGFGGESYATLDQRSSTVIRHATGEEAGVEALRTALGADYAAEVDPTLPGGTVALYLGADFALPAAPASGQDSSRASGGSAPAATKQDTTSAPDDENDGEQPITAGGVPCVY